MSNRNPLLDDSFGGDDYPEFDDLESRQRPTLQASPQEIDPEAAARPTVQAGPSDLEAASRPTVAASPADLEDQSRPTRLAGGDFFAAAGFDPGDDEAPHQKHGSREGFDERFERVMSRKQATPSTPSEFVPLAPPDSPPQAEQLEQAAPVAAPVLAPQAQAAPYLPPPPPSIARPKPKKSGAGWLNCFILGAAGLCSLSLILVASFLPPLSDYNPLAESLASGEAELEALNEDSPVLDSEGLRLSLSEGEMSLAAESVTAAQYAAGQVPAENWVCPAAAQVPRYIQLQGRVYSLTGEGEGQVEARLTLPEGADPYQMDVYGLYGDQWLFIPSQAAERGTQKMSQLAVLPDCLVLGQAISTPPLVSLTLQAGELIRPELLAWANRLFVGGMSPLPDGRLRGVLLSNVNSTSGYTPLPMISNAAGPGARDTLTLQSILGSPDLRAAHVTAIIDFLLANQFSGVVIDYQGLNSDQTAQFNDLIYRLGQALEAQKLSLLVVLDSTASGAYDWPFIGRWADEVILLAPLDPSRFGQGGDLPNLLQGAVSQISRYKISLAVSALSVDTFPDREAQKVGLAQAWSGLEGVNFVPAQPAPGTSLEVRLAAPLEFGLDETLQMPFIRYADLRTTWLSNPASLLARMRISNPYTLAGVALWDTHAPETHPQLESALRAYQEGSDIGTSPLSINWRISDATGALLSEQALPPTEALIFEVTGGEAGYQFEAQVAGDGGGFSLGSGTLEIGTETAALPPSPTVSLASSPSPTLAATTAPTEVSQAAAPTEVSQAATFTPTPFLLPSFTPSPTVTVVPATETPIPTPTLPPSPVPTINVPEIQGRVSRESGFEYGAHVGYDITDPDKLTKMQIAGMNWMKIQIRFKPGMNADDYGWQVQFLHERGIKILWGVVGEKADIFSPGYIEAYAAFVGRLAEIGSDAIEVWNEPNIDREWPTGQVSGESYMRLLRPAYEAIKARNPNTLVISAATAPTGFFGGCKAEGCDDDVYYRQLAQAGAANYLDCVGAHYNEGVVSPLATTGDPRNPYPTQYLISNTDRAYLPFASSGKPVCYTELGYLTAEGYDSGLPPGFEWAGGVTVANQAAWLATAAVVLSQTGHVRLMIIWNLDYKDFNPDPHGGFAMIRPDGGCPACDSLGLVKPE